VEEAKIWAELRHKRILPLKAIIVRPRPMMISDYMVNGNLLNALQKF